MVERTKGAATQKPTERHKGAGDPKKTDQRKEELSKQLGVRGEGDPRTLSAGRDHSGVTSSFTWLPRSTSATGFIAVSVFPRVVRPPCSSVQASFGPSRSSAASLVISIRLFIAEPIFLRVRPSRLQTATQSVQPAGTTSFQSPQPSEVAASWRVEEEVYTGLRTMGRPLLRYAGMYGLLRWLRRRFYMVLGLSCTSSQSP